MNEGLVNSTPRTGEELGWNGFPTIEVMEWMGPGGLMNITGKSITSATYATLKPKKQSFLLKQIQNVGFRDHCRNGQSISKMTEQTGLFREIKKNNH